MAVRYQVHRDGVDPSPPAGGRLSPEALERIEHRRQGGPGSAASGDGGDGGEHGSDPAPGTIGDSPEGQSQAQGQAQGQPQPQGQAGQGQAQGEPGAGPTAQPPAAPAEPASTPSAGQQAVPDMGDMEHRIELERAHRELSTATSELRRLQQETQRLQEAERQRAEAARDPRQLLVAHGHDPMQFVERFLGEGQDDAGGGQQGMGSDSRSRQPQAAAQGGVDPSLQEFMQRMEQRLEGFEQRWGQQDAQAARSRQLDDLRATVEAAGEHMSALSSLGLYDAALSHLETLAQAEGAPLTPAQRMRALHQYEQNTRNTASEQLRALAKVPWAVEVMAEALARDPGSVQTVRKALDSAAGERPAPGSAQPSTSVPANQGHFDPNQPSATPQGAATEPASQSSRFALQDRTQSELKEAGRRRVQELLDRKRQGLG